MENIIGVSQDKLESLEQKLVNEKLKFLDEYCTFGCDKYDADYSALGEEIMGGCLEEHLNWVYSSYKKWPENGIDGYLDLLLPVKLK